jgi:hypothetical protein
VIEALLAATFDGEVPPLVRALTSIELAERHALAFKAAPILPVHHDGPARWFVSNGHEPDWIERVADATGDPRARPFLDQGPPHTRRIVDTDGSRCDLYLDDLQDVPHDLEMPGGLQLMCATLALPSGAQTRLTRHGALPVDLLDAVWRERAAAVLARGFRGLWGVRWAQGIASLLLVNEDRWQGHPGAAADRVDALGLPRWARLRAVARAAGLDVYPDAIEVHPHGWDLTVGLYDPARPGSRSRAS